MGIERGKTALIDADSLIYYEMGKDTLEIAIEGIDSRIMQMLKVTGAEKYELFLTDGKCFRYAVAKNRPYKGNRKNGNKPIIFPAIKEHLRQRWGAHIIKALEADDLVSFYHKRNLTVICSPDKDVLYQNVGKHYNYGKAEFVKVTLEESIRFLWKQVLMGDSTDGIEGLPKIGEKTAEKILKDVEIDDMPSVVLKQYIFMFGVAEGINKYTETFKLIYILKDKEDVMRETGLILPDLFTHPPKTEECR